MTTTIFSKGEMIGERYEIKQFLAAGGMQEVYIASDQILPREVALKTPKNDSAAKRFKGSAELSARVNHPFVAKTFDYFESQERAFLVEELINGPNLDDFRLHLPRFDPHLLAQFGHQIAKGVAASHHVGVVHRDLKPNNIIVFNRNGLYEFKVTDFGIAKLTEEELDRAHKSDTTISSSSTMFGALPYMSPEIIENPRAAGKPADVWAIGAILFTLLSGNVPFGQGLKAIPRIMAGTLPEKPSICDQFTQYKSLCNEIWQIVVQCLTAEISKRPSADELIVRFENLCYGVYARKEGKILRYKHAEVGAYGFISSDSGDVFFHRDSFYGENIVAGQRVLFSPHHGHPQQRAHPVVPLAA